MALIKSSMIASSSSDANSGEASGEESTSRAGASGDDGSGTGGGGGEMEERHAQADEVRACLHRFAVSDNAGERQMGARHALKTLQMVGDDLPAVDDVFHVILSRFAVDEDPIVRAELLEQLPLLCVHCSQSPVLQDRIASQLTPVLASFLRDSNAQVRKTCQAAVHILLEHELLDQAVLQEHICPALFAQADPTPDTAVFDELRLEAVTLLCKIISSSTVDEEWAFHSFMPRYCRYCQDAIFHIRKVCAVSMGEASRLLGAEVTEGVLVPHLLSLSEDNVWGVRKAAAECYPDVAKLCAAQTRRSKLAPMFVRLLADPSRWSSLQCTAAGGRIGRRVDIFYEWCLLQLAKVTMYACLIELRAAVLLYQMVTQPRSTVTATCHLAVCAVQRIAVDACAAARNMARPEVPWSWGSSGSSSTASSSCGGSGAGSNGGGKESPSKHPLTDLPRKPSGELVLPPGTPKVPKVPSLDPIADEDQSSPGRRKANSESEEMPMLDDLLSDTPPSGRMVMDFGDDSDSDDDEPVTIDFKPRQLKAADSDAAQDAQKVDAKPEPSPEPTSGVAQAAHNGDAPPLEHTVRDVRAPGQHEQPCDQRGAQNGPANSPPSDDTAFDAFNFWKNGHAYRRSFMDELGKSVLAVPGTDAVADSSGGCASADKDSRAQCYSQYMERQFVEPAVVDKLLEEAERHVQSTNITDDRKRSSTGAKQPTPGRESTPHEDFMKKPAGFMIGDDENESDEEDIQQQSHRAQMPLDELPPEVVPEELLLQYTSMTQPERAATVEADICRHCAFALPAVALTLGRQHWPRLRPTYLTLSNDMQWKVRRTLAFSIHEMAAILGAELTERDLLPVFENFLRDLDEVRIGMLKHLYDFAKLLSPSQRTKLLPHLADFLQMDSPRNWRFRHEFAKQCTLLCELYAVEEINKYISAIGLTLAIDKVSDIRRESALLLSTVLKCFFDKEAAADPPHSFTFTNVFIDEIIKGFARSMRWPRRQSYAHICEEIVARRAVSPDYFTQTMLQPLIQLQMDKISGVRIASVRALASALHGTERFAMCHAAREEVQQRMRLVLDQAHAWGDRECRIAASRALDIDGDEHLHKLHESAVAEALSGTAPLEREAHFRQLCDKVDMLNASQSDQSQHDASGASEAHEDESGMEAASSPERHIDDDSSHSELLWDSPSFD